MWLIFVFFYVILTVIFTQSYKVTTRTAEDHGSLTVLLQSLGGISILLLCPFFKFTFPSDYRVYLFLAVAIVFYAISDRLNTTVRAGIEASMFSIIQQLSTVFMIVAGLLFFKEPLIPTKIVGAVLIIFSNILIFYRKGSGKPNKYLVLGVLSYLAFSVALFLDVNISGQFNLAFYVSLTLLGPALVLFVSQRIKPKSIVKEFKTGNKRGIMVTGFSWGIMIICQLKAYQMGEVISVAPLCALSVIANVAAGFVLLKERDHLIRKIIAAVLIIVSVILINL